MATADRAPQPRRAVPLSEWPRPRKGTRRAAPTKVPERITVVFWIIKLFTTAMGEATSDYLVHRINPFVAVAIAAVVFVVALSIQLAVRRYIAWCYWFAVAMVSVFGTMGADGLHVQFGVAYAASGSVFLVALIVVFALWQRSEGTLSIHSITTRRRELFYWVTVLATFALGTAVGDFTAATLHLGYLGSACIFAVAFAVPGLLYWRGRLGAIAAFWTAYVLTRPFGASVADYLGVPHSLSGLNLGRGNVAIGLAVPIVVLVAYLTVTRADTTRS